MTGSKSEDSISSVHSSEYSSEHSGQAAVGEKKAVQSTPNYETETFSKPALDQFDGVFPDLNRRLSQDRDLGLSPSGQPRLSSDTRPRLFSGQGFGLGLGTGMPIEAKPEGLDFPAGKGLEIKPDMPGRTLSGKKVGSVSIGADLPQGPVESKLMSLSSTEEKLKNAEKNRK